MAEWERQIAGEDVDAIIGTCICCGLAAQMAVTLFNYEGADPIQMCDLCYSITEDNDLDPIEVAASCVVDDLEE
jgi:hypothetical protein